MTQEFGGKWTLVTGSASGIGLQVARELASRGAQVIGVDLHEGDFGDVGRFVAADVTREESVAHASRQVADITGGSLDVLINNAGIGAIGDVTEASPEEWEKVFSVNVFGTARMVRLFAPLLLKGSAPAIVNTCSVASPVGIPKRAVYSASKGALESLTRAMAADFLPSGIRVNGVTPGTADTPWVQRLLAQTADPEGERARLEARQPIGRLVSAEEVAYAICYLASPRVLSTTGTILAVDGGMASLRIPQ